MMVRQLCRVPLLINKPMLVNRLLGCLACDVIRCRGQVQLCTRCKRTNQAPFLPQHFLCFDVSVLSFFLTFSLGGNRGEGRNHASLYFLLCSPILSPTSLIYQEYVSVHVWYKSNTLLFFIKKMRTFSSTNPQQKKTELLCSASNESNPFRSL